VRATRAAVRVLRDGAIAALIVLGGCAPPRIDATSQGTTMLEVTITATGDRPGRPPLIRLLVEATISNPGTDPRWALVPTKLPVGAGGVDKLEQLSAGGLTVGRFLGRGGFYAVKLAPGAKVTLKNLELAWWSTSVSDSPPAFEVRSGTGVTLGTSSIDTWFEADPAATGTAVVDMDQAKHTRSQRSPDDKEVDVAIAGVTTTSVQVHR